MDLLRHLRLFVTVADELHFSRAAERLGMAQPPLSQAIRRLEKELGAELFDRSQRGVRLSAAGAALLAQAHGLLAQEERLRTLARLAADGGLGTLRAGVPPGTTAAVLSALLSACAEHSPGLTVDLREVTTEEQVRLLSSGGLDAGLVHHPVDATELRLGPEISLEWGVVLPRTSPLTRRSEVTLGELSGHDLVLFPRAQAPGWYDRILDVCRAGGFVPGRLRHASNPEFQLALVTAGHGVAFDQGPMARKEPRVAWRALAGRPLTLRMGGAWPAGRGAHPAAPRFAELAAGVLARDHTAAPRREGVPRPSDESPRPWSVIYG